MKKLTVLLTVMVAAATVTAQSIPDVNATIEILPASWWNHEAEWTAEVCVINSGLNYYDGDNRQYYNQVWGTPQQDAAGNDWFAPAFSTADNAGEWSVESAPFCDSYYAGQFGRESFVWAEESIMADVYLRRTFTVARTLDGDVYLACGHDDAPAEWYINGVLVKSIDDRWKPEEYIKLTEAQKALIKTDGTENLIAVHMHNNYGGSLADCGLYMTGSSTPDPDPDPEPSGESLDFGYNTPWTGKAFFNPGLTFSGAWPQLCQAKEGDTYTISLPAATDDLLLAQVAFRTPIRLDASHTYRFTATLRPAKGTVRQADITLCEGEDDNTIAATGEVRLYNSNRASTATLDNITGTDIENLKITFDVGNNSAGTEIELTAVSLIDKTDGDKELWQGSAYYIQGYCAPDGTRTNDPVVTGTTKCTDWTKPDFDDTMWDDWVMPIGNWGFIGEVQTLWPGDNYNNFWIRRTFNLETVENTTAYTLHLCHDDSYAAYVNGHLLGEGEDWTVGKEYIDFDIPSRYMQAGKNVIAVYQKQNVGGKFFDCALTVTPNAHEPYDDVDPSEALVANELMVGNIDQYIDYSFNYGAWLELYNKSDKNVSLGGLYLSDDPADPMKFQLPQNYGVIKAHGYKAIYFDHNKADGEYGKTADKQVRFKLNEEGGMLYVSDQDGIPFIEMIYPEAVSRCSYARREDGTGEWAYTGTPTLEATNAGSNFASTRLDAPKVNTDSRQFDSPFVVGVTFPGTASLHYTLDGSAPTLDSPQNSSGNFEISETTTLRLRLFQNGKLPSPVVTRTYIKRDQDYYLPIIAISTAEQNLYGDSIGIYCVGKNGINARNSGRNSNINMDWERPVNFEYITADGKMAVNQEAEMSIVGGWSRHYAPASFKLKARNLYDGQKQFNHQFFARKPYNKYKMVLVRNGGNDNDSQQHGRIKDAIIQQTLLTSGIYVDCQDLQPTHVFFNGKLIGMLNLREPSTKFYGSANYGYDKDNMDAFEYSNGYYQKAGDKASFDEWLSLSAQVSDDAKYEELRQKVDIDEFINYMAAITYIGSSDWICNSNNSKGFRSRDDGKFHMVVFDVDWGFSNSRALGQILDSNANDLIRIFKNSLANDAFKRQFIDSYCLMGGSVFTAERSKAVADSLVALMQPALAIDGKDPTYSYNELVPRMTSDSERETRIQTLRERMGLDTGMKMRLTANIPEAQFRLNGLNVPLNKFDGTAFAPFTLEVSAPAGYNFKGWRTNASVTETLTAKGDEWMFYDKGSLDGTDWKTASIPPVGTAGGSWLSGPQPIGYGKSDIATQTEQYHSTYYLRKTVTLSDEPADDDVFTMNYVADDGWIIYVNGTEAARYLMPDGPSSYETLATTYAPGNPDRGTVSLPANLFHKGQNIIAVDLHNNKLPSTDIYWNVEIVQKRTGGNITHADRTYEITEDQDQDITAIFEPLDDEYLNHAGATPVVINEVSAANSIFANDYNKRNDWIELYNTTDESIDVAGMFLSDDPADPRKYQIQPSSSTIPHPSSIISPHGYLVVWADKLDPLSQLHATFKLGNNDDECVILTAADGSWSDQLTYCAHTGEESVGRYPDGGKRVFLMTRPTIAAMNQLTTYSEWLYGEDIDFDPATGVERGEWREEKGERAGGHIVSTEYFTVDGVRLSKPQRGITILRITYASGEVKTKKMVTK